MPAPLNIMRMTTPVHRSCHLITPRCLGPFPNIPDAIATEPRETIPARFFDTPQDKQLQPDRTRDWNDKLRKNSKHEKQEFGVSQTVQSR